MTSASASPGGPRRPKSRRRTFGFRAEDIWITVFAGDEELGLGPDEEAIEAWLAVGVPRELARARRLRRRRRPRPARLPHGRRARGGLGDDRLGLSALSIVRLAARRSRSCSSRDRDIRTWRRRLLDARRGPLDVARMRLARGTVASRSERRTEAGRCASLTALSLRWPPFPANARCPRSVIGMARHGHRLTPT